MRIDLNLQFYGVWDFEFPISDLLRSTKNVQRYKLVVRAKVMDARTSLVRRGHSESLIFRKSYTLRFEGPAKQVFKPGLPFRAYVSIKTNTNRNSAKNQHSTQKSSEDQSYPFSRGEICSTRNRLLCPQTSSTSSPVLRPIPTIRSRRKVVT